MDIKRILVTPEVANAYLLSNNSNRKIKNPVVLRYVDDMKNGNWKENTGELIKIATDGTILDGQHRLMAVVKSGVSVNFDFAFNLDKSVFDVLDTGSTRSASDVFHIQGVKNNALISAFISAYLTLKSGNKVYSTQIHYKPNNSSLLSEYKSKKDFYDNVAIKVNSLYNSFAKILIPSTIGGLFLFFYDLSPNQAEEFMNQLCTGVGIQNKTIELLRKELMMDKMSVSKMPMNLKLGLIIKTWNLFRQNKEELSLKSEVLKEPFPIAI